MIVGQKLIHPEKINQQIIIDYLNETIKSEQKAVKENKKLLYKGDSMAMALRANQINYHNIRITMIKEMLREVEA